MGYWEVPQTAEDLAKEKEIEMARVAGAQVINQGQQPANGQQQFQQQFAQQQYQQQQYQGMPNQTYDTSLVGQPGTYPPGEPG